MSDSCCHGHLNAQALEAGQRRVLTWVLVINVLAFLIMVAGAVFSGSSSLLSGTLDNLGDALTCALSLAVVGAGRIAKARVAFLKGLLILGAALAVAVHIGWHLSHVDPPLDNLGDALIFALCLAVVGAGRIAKAHVTLLKGLLILGAALAVAVHLGWHLSHLDPPIIGTMGVAAILNLAANLLCLRLLYPYRNGDVNMTSVWECSRNDVIEGIAVIAAALLVWTLDSGWPDVFFAIVLLTVFLRSAIRVLSSAWRELFPAHSLS